jgi:hypothetical protein
MFKPTVVAIALLITPSVSAAEICIHNLPSKREGHWKYRYVNHEKCWFGPGAGRSSTGSQGESNRPRRAERKRPAPPAPVESIADAIEEEVPDPTLYNARRVKIFAVKREPPPSSRIDAVFNEFVIRCETDIRACDGLKH